MHTFLLQLFAKPASPLVCPSCGNSNPALMDVRPDRVVCLARLTDGDLCAFEWTPAPDLGAPIATRALLVAAALCTLTACGPVHFNKANFSQAQFEIDKAQCIYEAELATVNMGNTGTQRYRNNGEAIGAGIGQGIAIGMAQRRLAIACLKARGYTASE